MGLTVRPTFRVCWPTLVVGGGVARALHYRYAFLALFYNAIVQRASAGEGSSVRSIPMRADGCRLGRGTGEGCYASNIASTTFSVRQMFVTIVVGRQVHLGVMRSSLIVEVVFRMAGRSMVLPV